MRNVDAYAERNPNSRKIKPLKKKKITVFQAHVVPTRLVETLAPDQFVNVSEVILVNPQIANLSVLKTLIVP